MKTNWLNKKGYLFLDWWRYFLRLFRYNLFERLPAIGPPPARWLPHALMPLESIVVPGFCCGRTTRSTLLTRYPDLAPEDEMHTKNQISRICKTSYGAMILAVILIDFGIRNLRSAREQGSATKTPMVC